MIYHNNSQLRNWLEETDPRRNAPFFEFDEEDFARAVTEIESRHQSMERAQVKLRAAYYLLTSRPDFSPGVAIPSGKNRHIFISWKRVFSVLKIAWAILLLIGIWVLVAKAEPPHNALSTEQILSSGIRRGVWASPVGGIVIQVQNQGTPLATRGGGLVIFNCSTNMSCSFSGSTFSISSSSTASTAWSALTASANSNAGTFSSSGNSWDFTAATIFKLRVVAGCTTSSNGDLCYDSTNNIWRAWQNATNNLFVAATNVGTSGQVCLSNANGSCTFADPQVTGNVASGAADSGNPVKTGYVFNTTPPTVTTGQRVDAQGTARGAAIVATGVDVFHVTVDAAPTTTVNGTVTANQGTAAAASSKWPIEIVDSAGVNIAAVTASNAVKVDGSAVTQPISAASLPLPTGASTEATLAKIPVAQASTTSGQSGPLNQCAVTTSAPTYTTAQTDPLSCNTSGGLRVDGSGVTQPVSGTVTANAGTGTFNIQANASVNVNQIAGSAVSTAATGTQKVGITGNTGAAMDAAGQNVASPANELLVGAQFNTTPTTIATGNMSPLQMDSAGNLLVNVKVGGGTGGTSSNFAAAFPGTGTAAGLKATASAPSYTEGNMQAFSSDLGGLLRVRCDTGCAAAGDTVGTSTSLAALNNTASVALAGENGANVIFTAASSPSFTVVAEVSPDGGTTWFTAVFLDPVSGATSTSLVNPANGQWMIGYVGPESNARVRVSAFTSGSITAQLRSTVTSPYKLVLGSDGTNVRIVRTATDGTVRIDPTGTTTQPISGTVTANAGTNLNTSSLQLDATGAKLNLAQASTTSGQTGPLIQGAVTTSAPSYTTAQTSPLSLNTAGGLRVDGSGVTQPVSGTVTANAGTGNFNAVGTQSDNSANSTAKLPVIPCRANASNPSWTEGNQVPCSTDLSGNQRLLLNSWLGSTAPTVGSKTSANSIPVVPASDWVDTATGNKSDNGAAAGADRITVLPAIIQTTPGNGTAGTQGRNAAIEKGTDGLAWVASLPARRPCSYYASTGTVGVTTAATATDIAVITGNATTDVLVTKIKVSGTQTTAGNVPIQIIRRSSADTAGTETNLTIGKDEPNCGASSIAASGVGVYTANPTLGTLDSIPDSYALGVMAPGTATANDIFILNRQQKPIVLVGTAQQLAVNICSNSVQACTGTTVTGGVFRITFEWEEVTHITP